MAGLFAIDPGPEQSAWVFYHAGIAMTWAKLDNHTILGLLDETIADQMAIEMIASYGMPVGAEVFETCVWTGRFIERWLTLGMVNFPRIRQRPEPCRVFRREVKSHLCGSPKATDSNIRQALIDRYGPGKEKAIGLKKSPGPLYGLKADCWAALGVAITAAETHLAVS